MKDILILLCLTIFAFTTSWADAPKDTFRLANEAMSQGNINDAISLYESIYHSHYTSSALTFNLGTAHAHQNNWPAARYYFEKAYQYDPYYPNLVKNLQFVRTKIDDLYPFPSYPLQKFIGWIHSILGANFLSIAMLVLFVSWWILRYLKPDHWKWINYSVTGLAIPIAILLALEITYAQNDRSMGIVWQEDLPLLAKPDEPTSQVAALRGGFKVKIIDKAGDWYQVDLADGSNGWISSTAIRLL